MIGRGSQWATATDRCTSRGSVDCKFESCSGHHMSFASRSWLEKVSLYEAERKCLTRGFNSRHLHHKPSGCRGRAREQTVSDGGELGSIRQRIKVDSVGTSTQPQGKRGSTSSANDAVYDMAIAA